MNKKDTKRLNVTIGFKHRELDIEPKYKEKEIVNCFRVHKSKYGGSYEDMYMMTNAICHQLDNLGGVVVCKKPHSLEKIVIYLYLDEIYKMSDFKIIDGCIYCKLSNVYISTKNKEEYNRFCDKEIAKRRRHYCFFEETLECFVD